MPKFTSATREVQQKTRKIMQQIAAILPYERRTVISSDGVKIRTAYSGTVYTQSKWEGILTSDKSDSLPLLPLENHYQPDSSKNAIGMQTCTRTQTPMSQPSGSTIAEWDPLLTYSSARLVRLRPALLPLHLLLLPC